MTRESDAVAAVDALERIRSHYRTHASSAVMAQMEHAATLSAPECWQGGITSTIDVCTSDAALYVATPAAASAALELSRDLPAHPVPSPDDLLAESAFVWLPEPLDLFAGDDVKGLDAITEPERDDPQNRALRAVSIHAVELPNPVTGERERFLTLLPFVDVTSWTADYPNEEHRQMMARILDSDVWPFDLFHGTPDRLSMTTRDGELPTIGDAELAADYDDANPDTGGWYGPGKGLLRWVLTFSTLAAQALETTPTPVPRPVRRRATRAGATGAAAPVSIVDLPRRPRSPGDPDDAGEGDPRGSAEYAATVTGYFRLQPHGPGSTLRRLQYIAPHVRGADKADRAPRRRAHRSQGGT